MKRLFFLPLMVVILSGCMYFVPASFKRDIAGMSAEANYFCQRYQDAKDAGDTEKMEALKPEAVEDLFIFQKNLNLMTDTLYGKRPQ